MARLRIGKLTVVPTEDVFPAGLAIVFLTFSVLAAFSSIIHGAGWLPATGISVFFLLASVVAAMLFHSVTRDRPCANCGGDAIRLPLSKSPDRIRRMRCADCGHIQNSPVQPRGRMAEPQEPRTHMTGLWEALYKPEESEPSEGDTTRTARKSGRD